MLAALARGRAFVSYLQASALWLPSGQYYALAKTWPAVMRAILEYAVGRAAEASAGLGLAVDALDVAHGLCRALEERALSVGPSARLHLVRDVILSPAASCAIAFDATPPLPVTFVADTAGVDEATAQFAADVLTSLFAGISVLAGPTSVPTLLSSLPASAGVADPAGDLAAIALAIFKLVAASGAGSVRGARLLFPRSRLAREAAASEASGATMDTS